MTWPWARPAEGQIARERARLVVLVVVDQLTTEHLDRYGPLLRGGLGRMMKSGAYYRQGRYAHANTETGPGHATVATGAWSDVHGIVGNKWVDHATGAMIRCVEDRQYGNSPQYLRVPGIADAIKVATQGRGKVIALAHKPRSSILVGGHRPDLAVWYDAKSGRFQTGRWPGLKAAPSWYAPAALRTGPARIANQSWKRFRDDIDYDALAGPDDRPFENNVPGLGRTFPHPLGEVPQAWPRAYPATPSALDDIMSLAEAAIENEELGADPFVDLLYLGLSGFDYVGHAYGPGSQESLDMLLRIDAALGDLQDRLSARLGGGRVLTVLTSDHGVMPIPEALAAQGLDAKRIPIKMFKSLFGPQLRAVQPPRVYLRSSRQPRSAVQSLKARRAWARRLAARPEIIEAYVPEDVSKFRAPYRVFFERMLVDGRAPDILFRHRPFRYISEVAADGSGEGTGHGSPYIYDQMVPILVHGSGVRSGVVDRPVMMTRVAPTIATALAIMPPPAAYAPALDAVER